MTFVERLKNIGPGALVAAAFIGPGTVTTCSRSGASFGYTLLWAMLFSTIATIILQEMAARLGISTQEGLGQNIRSRITNTTLRAIAVVIVIAAIFIGNIAYEAGNLTGGAMGLETLIPSVPLSVWGLLLGGIAFMVLWKGSYKMVESFLVALVIVMSFVFIITAIASKPNIAEIIKGLFVPNVQEKEWMTVIGLIGTTIVPYNLFLHASSSAERWKNPDDIKNARVDSILSIGLGGIISMSIIIAAAANVQGTNIKNGADMALAIEPVVGSWAKWFIGIGLFAAGFTSAITAPLAAAFATSGVLGQERNLKAIKFKTIWIIVLFVGIALTVMGQKSPTELILVAQVANAIILPVMALFLIYCMNDEKLGRYKNKWYHNAMGAVIILVTFLIFFRNMTNFINSLKSFL